MATDDKVIASVVVFALLFACTVISTALSQGCERNKAKEGGVGQWTINKDTGDKKFEYGCIEKEEKQ